MATTLPVFQSTNLTGGLLTFATTAWASIPTSNFVVGRRYLVLYHCEVQGSTTSGGKVWADYNGSTTGIDSGLSEIKRNDAIQYTSVNFMERLTVPAGAGDGLALRAQLMTGATYPGAAIRNVRLIAIDLDVNNTDFPQQNGNGWLLQHSNLEILTLSSTWQHFLPITFTPDGVSDYLILACGMGYNSTGWTYFGIGVDGGVYTASYASSTSSSLHVPMFCSHVLKKPPPTPTTVTIAGARSDASARIDEPRFIVLRLNTFTKYGAQTVSNPTVISGTAWQSAQTITPTPAPVAGEQFLVFSRIQGYNWVSNDAIFGMRVLRSGNQIATAKSSDLAQSAGDFLGPAFTLLSTAGGDDTYEQQFQKENYVDRPVNIYYSTLAAFKTEVGYTAPTAKVLPVVSSAITGDTAAFPQSPSWLTFLTIPGSKFANGNRHLVLVTFSQAVFGTTSEFCAVKMQFNTSQVCISQESNQSNRKRPSFMMARVTGTGAGVGLELLGQRHAISFMSTYASHVRVLIIDLDAQPTEFPPESNAGWLYAENLISAANPLTPTWLTHSTLSFTPDGTSDYLIIADLVLYDSGQNAGQSSVRLLDGAALLEPALTYADGNTVGMSTHMNIMVPLFSPAATAMVLNLQAQRLTAASYGQVSQSRIFVMRLDCFKSHMMEFTTGDQINSNAYPTWYTLESGTPSPALPIDYRSIVIARSVDRNWADPSNFMHHRLRRTPSGVDTYTQGSSGRGTSSANRYPHTIAMADVPPVAGTGYTFDTQNESGYPVSATLSHVLLASFGTELGVGITVVNISGTAFGQSDARGDIQVFTPGLVDGYVDVSTTYGPKIL